MTDLVAAFLAQPGTGRDITKLKWFFITDIMEKSTDPVVLGITKYDCVEVTGEKKTAVEGTVLGKLAMHFAADFGFQVGKVFAFVPDREHP
ncbi:MAG: hypothetical protein Q9184_008334, partial [Pyrenodesmia sp. 2 TL-2023]